MRADTTMNGRDGKSRTILWRERRKREGKESEVGRENGRFNIEGGVWISRDQDKHVLKLQRAGNFPCA
jgi:hypothetical protein